MPGDVVAFGILCARAVDVESLCIRTIADFNECFADLDVIVAGSADAVSIPEDVVSHSNLEQMRCDPRHHKMRVSLAAVREVVLELDFESTGHETVRLFHGIRHAFSGGIVPRSRTLETSGDPLNLHAD